MNTQKYNGFTNYVTWLCNMWFNDFDFTDMMDMFNNCEDSCDVLDIIENYIKEYVEEFVKNSLEKYPISGMAIAVSPSLQYGFIHDILTDALIDIDWRDIAEHYVDDVVDELKLIKDDAKSELMGV